MPSTGPAGSITSTGSTGSTGSARSADSTGPADPANPTGQAAGGVAPETPSQPSSQPLWSDLWSGAVGLLALLPILVGALGVVAPIAYGLHRVWPTWGAVVPFAVWCGVAPPTLLPAGRLLTARLTYGGREPDDTERDRLDRAWRLALRRAALTDREYRLLVTDSTEPNACTPTGRIVTITSRSARSAAPDRLAALLAHELAHRRGRHGVLMDAHAALMLPIRALWWLLHAMWSPVAPMWRRAVAWHRPIGFLLTFLLAIAATAVSVVAALPAAIAAGGVLAARLLAGQAEYRADAVVVRLGLGPELLAALEHAIDATQHGDPTAKPFTPSAPPASPPPLPLPLVRRAGRLRRRLARAPGSFGPTLGQ